MFVNIYKMRSLTMRENHSIAKHSVFVLLILTLITSGCFSVKLIADYDEQLDKGITEFQKYGESFDNP